MNPPKGVFTSCPWIDEFCGQRYCSLPLANLRDGVCGLIADYRNYWLGTWKRHLRCRLENAKCFINFGCINAI
jgi:hypothetical protein